MRLTACNPAAARALGYSIDEVMGRSISEFIPDEGFATNQAMLAQKLKEGGATRYTLPVLARDGSRRLWQINSTLTHDSRGRPVGLHAIARDVSEEQAMAATLRESEERFRAIFEAAPVGIVECDVSGQYLRVNERFREITGYGEVELLGRTFHEVTHPGDLALEIELLGRLVAGQVDRCTMEKRYVRKDGTLRRVHLTISAVRRPEGGVENYIGIVEDVRPEAGGTRASAVTADGERER